jgi:hypothetical protein
MKEEKSEGKVEMVADPKRTKLVEDGEFEDEKAAPKDEPRTVKVQALMDIRNLRKGKVLRAGKTALVTESEAKMLCSKIRTLPTFRGERSADEATYHVVQHATLVANVA